MFHLNDLINTQLQTTQDKQQADPYNPVMADNSNAFNNHTHVHLVNVPHAGCEQYASLPQQTNQLGCNVWAPSGTLWNQW
jgi:hypothetical protein